MAALLMGTRLVKIVRILFAEFCRHANDQYAGGPFFLKSSSENMLIDFREREREGEREGEKH